MTALPVYDMTAIDARGNDQPPIAGAETEAEAIAIVNRMFAAEIASREIAPVTAMDISEVHGRDAWCIVRGGALMNEETFDDLRDRLIGEDDDDHAAAHEELGAYVNTGLAELDDELRRYAQAIEPDFVCVLDDGRIVSWGADHLRYPGAIGRDLILVDQDEARAELKRIEDD